MYSLKNKRVWVAGHKGLVGQALARRLPQEECEILKVDRETLDLRDQSAVKAWMQIQKPDAVIIAAAKVGGIHANSTAPANFFFDNMMIEANILHAAYEVGVQKLIFLGSSCIYPRDCLQPIREEYLLTGPLEPTNEAYALAKIAGLKMAQFYRKQYGCDFISVMPCNLFGIGDRYDETQSHVIPALIMKMQRAKTRGDDSVTLWGTGRALREFLDSDDLADALVFLMKNYSATEPINVGSGQEISIRDLTEEIRRCVGFEGEIYFDVSKPDGTPRKIMDTSRLTELGWHPRMCLNNGLKKAYKDYLGRYWDDKGEGHHARDIGRRQAKTA